MTSDKRYHSRALKFISYDTAVREARRVFDYAVKVGIPSMLIGGVAMEFYGSDRLTKDVDFAAARELPENDTIPWTGSLSFGGAIYKPEDVEIDWVVRADEYQDLYQAAVDARAQTDLGIDIVLPEYLVIMKIVAGRGKDHQDALFLLRQPNLVDRGDVERLLRRIFGRAAIGFIRDLTSFAFEADRQNHLDR